MIIVDRLLRQREEQGNPIQVGLIGAGFMGRGLVNQVVNSVPGMRVAAISNRTIEKAHGAYADAGIADVAAVASADAIDDCIRQGRPAITEDATNLCDAEGIDCLVDVTGSIEFGARVTLRAMERGKHVVSMNAELDGTVGPILKRYADAYGVILTASDGDQPGVQMNLYRFVRSIGLTPLVCGNVKFLQDPHRNPTTQAQFAARWGQTPHMVTSFADGTKISFEQALVANGTGMTVARRGMLGYDHEGHVDELVTRYDVEMLRELGGIVDYVVGAKPGPAVFVLAAHDDTKQQHYLDLYKLGSGPLYSFYTPYHLCHFEVPLSVARLILCQDPVLQPLGGPKVDVVATAKVDLKAGDLLDGIGGYKTYGQCEKYDVSRSGLLLPVGLAEGCRVRSDIQQDTVIRYEDVEIPAGRLINRLRDEQDRLYPV